jgi:hypothetical protein
MCFSDAEFADVIAGRTRTSKDPAAAAATAAAAAAAAAALGRARSLIALALAALAVALGGGALAWKRGWLLPRSSASSGPDKDMVWNADKGSYEMAGRSPGKAGQGLRESSRGRLDDRGAQAGAGMATRFGDSLRGWLDFGAPYGVSKPRVVRVGSFATAKNGEDSEVEDSDEETDDDDAERGSLLSKT